MRPRISISGSVRPSADADGKGEEEHVGCKEGAGSKVVAMENRKEGVGKNRSCDAYG